MPKRFDEAGMAEYRAFNTVLGARIKVAREANGFTQEDLAKLIGRDKLWVSAIELGRYGLNAMDLGKFAEALDRPLSYFYGDTEGGIRAPRTFGEWMALYPGEDDRARSHFDLDRIYQRASKARVLA